MTFTCRVCLQDAHGEPWCDFCGKRIVPLPVNNNGPGATPVATPSRVKDGG